MENDRLDITKWLPTTRKEMELRGWDEVDVVLLSGDAYVDHPSFGAAVIGRILEAEGLRVGIIPQPSWHGDLRDFSRLGRPRLFFGIAPGCMDSMVNKYTAARRLRKEDAYSPNGRHDMRPEYPTIVYTECIRRLYPDAPIVLGGIEASLRRLSHYDYWKEKLRPSILCDCDADMISYGMGEKNTPELARRLLTMIDSYDEALVYDEMGNPCISREAFRKAVTSADYTADKDTPITADGICQIPQTVLLYQQHDIQEMLANADTNDGKDKSKAILLHSFEDCLKDAKLQSENFRHIEEESNKMQAQVLIQQTGNQYVVASAPYPPLTTEELDHSFDLPYTRLPHPKYKGKRIPAYDMIKFSVNMHRGCFGGCAFCTISAHQGKFIVNRSKESILNEVKAITQMPDFKGYLSDLGGPSANMYGMKGRNEKACAVCKRPSCIHPEVCPNLNVDHRPILDIYRSVDALPGIKKSFIGSGVRYDLLLHQNKDEKLNQASREYTRELIKNHVSGRLKVAPEHTSDKVLEIMRKPSFRLFGEFKRIFDEICRREHLNQQIIPYFISSHPGCKSEDMAELAVLTKDMNFQLEQVQDFTPTPMTVATEAWYSGYHPYTLEPVYCAHSPEEKQAQRMFFFWYKPEEQHMIVEELKRMGRYDLINKLGLGQTSRSSAHQEHEKKGYGSRDHARKDYGSRDHTSKDYESRDRASKDYESGDRGHKDNGNHSAPRPKSYNPNFNKAYAAKRNNKRK